jgi:hypothetical protein
MKIADCDKSITLLLAASRAQILVLRSFKPGIILAPEIVSN